MSAIDNLQTYYQTHKINEILNGGFVVYVDDSKEHGLIASTNDLGRMNYNNAKSFNPLLKLNGFSGWYLPSKNELNLLYQAHMMNIGEFANDWYWSSTENATTSAWIQSFSNGIQTNDRKYNANIRVRLIRSF